MNYVITYRDENGFNKLNSALKKYNMLAFKKLNIDIITKLKSGELVGFNVRDNIYEVKLPADEVFNQVYGQLKLIYSVFNKQIRLDMIEPSWILEEAHKGLLDVYKGVILPETDKAKYKFKIDVINKIKND